MDKDKLNCLVDHGGKGCPGWDYPQAKNLHIPKVPKGAREPNPEEILHKEIAEAREIIGELLETLHGNMCGLHSDEACDCPRKEAICRAQRFLGKE